MCSWRKSTCAKRQRIRCFSASQLKSTKEVQFLHFVRDQRMLGFIIKLYQCAVHKYNVMNLLTSRRLSWIMSKTVDYFNTFRICRFVTLLWKACHLYNNYLRVNGLKWYIECMELSFLTFDLLDYVSYLTKYWICDNAIVSTSRFIVP